MNVPTAQAALTAAQQAHAAARSPWARFRCRCAVLAAEGRLQAAQEAQAHADAEARRLASFSWADHRPSGAVAYTRPTVVLDARGKTWDRDAVNALICRASVGRLLEMLRAIAQRHSQNAARGLTRDDNGRGFFAFEAGRLLTLAGLDGLTAPEGEQVRVALRRYAGQLLEVIGERAQVAAA